MEHNSIIWNICISVNNLLVKQNSPFLKSNLKNFLLLYQDLQDKKFINIVQIILFSV